PVLWSTPARGATPPCGGAWVVGSVAAEDLLGDGHRGEGLRPAGVEGQVRDELDELLLGDAVVLRVLQVEGQLLGVAAGEQGGDGSQAAVALRQLRALPDPAEQVGHGNGQWEHGCQVARGGVVRQRGGGLPAPDDQPDPHGFLLPCFRAPPGGVDAWRACGAATGAVAGSGGRPAGGGAGPY